MEKQSTSEADAIDRLGIHLHFTFPKWKRFTERYAEALGTRANVSAATKRIRRYLNGKPIPIEGMKAIAAVLDKSLEQVDKEVLLVPGFCKEKYGLNHHDYSLVLRVPFENTAVESTAPEKIIRVPDHDDSNTKKEFKEFFGPTSTESVQLMFPKRVLNGNVWPFIDDENESECPLLTEENHLCPNASPEGVSGVYLAFEDIKAVTHISHLISQETNNHVWVRPDSGHAFDNRNNTCIISLGLASSIATRMTQNYFQNPELFWVFGKIVYKEQGEGGKASGMPQRVNMIKFQYQDPNGGKPFLRLVEDRPKKDIAIIARIVPNQKTDPKRSSRQKSKGDRNANSTEIGKPWIIVGGRTGIGTSVAGYYLANKWRNLHKFYKEHEKKFDQHSLAVVIEYKKPLERNPSVDSAFDIDESGKLRYWDKETKQEPCIAWGQWDETAADDK